MLRKAKPCVTLLPSLRERLMSSHWIAAKNLHSRKTFWCTHKITSDGCSSSGPSGVSPHQKSNFSIRSHWLASGDHRYGGDWNTSVSLDVVGTGGSELSPSLLLNCPNKTYLFNCGEGWYRTTISHQKRVMENRMFFFTHACWENFGGSSVFHQAREGHFMRQQFVGPRRSDSLMEYIMYFKGRNTWENARLDEDSSVLRGEFTDENLAVFVVDINPESDAVSEGYLVAYSCQLLRAKNDSGRTRIVKEPPIEVMHASESEPKGPTFLVVDCPSERFVGPVTSNPHLQPEWFKEREQSVDLIVHMTPLDILDREQYCKWLASFGQGTKHLLLHGSVCPGEVGYRAAMTFSLPFHLLNPNVYHFPHFPDSNVIPKSSLVASKYIEEDSIAIGQMFMRYHLTPRLSVDTSACLGPVQNHVARDLAAIRKEEWLFRQLEACRKRISTEDIGKLSAVDLAVRDNTLPSLTDPNDAMVTVLGTSATKVTPLRNVSGILVQTLRDGNILLDCGEGTLCQLQRAFGHTATRNILQKLKVIFISHDHLDHHLGLISVLKEVQTLERDCDVNGRGLTVIADLSFLQMLRRYRSKCEDILQFEGIDICDAAKTPYSLNRDVTVKTVPANHTQNCHSALLRKRNKWSVVYSSDTRPSRYLAKKGYGATLLIHEGTYVSKHPKAASDAKLNKHSTYFEAVRVGELMNAQFTIVTHFSTRHALDALFLRESFPATCSAVDLMSVKLSDLNRQLLDSEQNHTAVRGIGHYNKKHI